MRISLAIVLPFLLGGCALPPAISIASLAVDGLSFASTGKSATDHAISATAKKDCAVFRVVKDEKVCKEFEEGEKPALYMAAEEWEAGGEIVGVSGPNAPARPVVETNTVPDQLVEDIWMEGAEGEGDASRPGSKPVPPSARTGAPIPVAVSDVLDELDRVEVARASEAESRPDAPKNAMPVARSVSNTRAVRVASRAPKQSENRTVTARVDSAQPAVKRTVVVGSFLDSDNARTTRASFRSFGSQVVRTKIGGKTWYRVITEPGTLRQTRRNLAEVKGRGASSAWMSRICADAETVNCVDLNGGV